MHWPTLLWLSVSLPAVAQTTARSCENDGAVLDTHFEGGAFHDCTVAKDGTFEVTIRPEDANVVVPMPWYAFRASPKKPGDVTVALTFRQGYARFWPKMSFDGESRWCRPGTLAAQRRTHGPEPGLGRVYAA